jgi:protein-disulfide isomerase
MNNLYVSSKLDWSSKLSAFSRKAQPGFVLASLVLAACNQGSGEVQYEYIFRTGAGAVAVAPAPGGLGIEASPSMGAANALVTIVESSDFQCPFCSKGANVMKEVLRAYPNDVKLVFKHNPLAFHKEALPAAKAAMAAHLQGKFWEYHDLLFGRKMFDPASLEGFAKELGLDVERWRQDMNSAAVADLIRHDQASVTSLGARGTPAFFINGKLLSGAQPLEAFKNEINLAIEEAKAEQQRGTPPEGLHAALAAKRGGASFVDAVILGKEPSGAVAAPAARERTPERAAAAPSAPVSIEVKPVDAMKGNPSAAVTIVEFSDFECPYCSKVGPTLKELEAKYGDKIKVVFKHLPLAFHKNARLAAIASVAANRQGKFWEYHDLLFANQRALLRPDLERYAEQLGLDMAKFRADLDSPEVAAQVDADSAEAKRIGVTGTPTSFVNGRIVKGASPAPAFSAIIDEVLGGAGSPAPAAVNAGSLLEDAAADVSVVGGIARGSDSAAVTAVVYVDLSAGTAAELFASIDRVLRNVGLDKIRVIVKPVGGRTEESKRAAEAGIVVSRANGDRALRYLRLVASEKRALPPSELAALAERAGIQVADLTKTLESGSVRKEVEVFEAEAAKLGLREYPAVFINGRRYKNASGFAAETLESAVAAARK